MPLVIEGATIIGDGALATMEGMNVVFCQLAPWQWEGDSKPNIKRTYRRVSFLASRLLANMGVHGETPLLARFAGARRRGRRAALAGGALPRPA